MSSCLLGTITHAYYRRLPHLSKRDKDYFVTFCTRKRFVLTPTARDLVLKSCVHDHGTLCWVYCAVVMPDHAHLIVTPYEDETITKIVGAIKGASSYNVNRLLGRRGHLWQEESFDRIVRQGEDLWKKAEYVCNNPVRAGLVRRFDDYRWVWRALSGAAGF